MPRTTTPSGSAGTAIDAPMPFAPPTLSTLESPPSWHTTDTGRARGKTSPDRSACVVLRPSVFAKCIPPDGWRRVLGNRERARAGSPGTSRAEARATYTLYAAELLAIADAKLPRPLAGDYRTAKSNAMRPPGLTHRQITRSPSRQMTKPGPDRGLPTNPNRLGIKHLFPPPTPEATDAIGGFGPNADSQRSATAGPDAAGVRLTPHATAQAHAWSQTLILEKHRHHAGLMYPYFRCPATKKRCKLLFLPFATAAEFADAALAHHWLTLPYDPAPPPLKTRLHATAVQLSNRYAPLFPPRIAVSREALGLRYGERKSGGSSRR